MYVGSTILVQMIIDGHASTPTAHERCREMPSWAALALRAILTLFLIQTHCLPRKYRHGCIRIWPFRLRILVYLVACTHLMLPSLLCVWYRVSILLLSTLLGSFVYFGQTAASLDLFFALSEFSVERAVALLQGDEDPSARHYIT